MLSRKKPMVRKRKVVRLLLPMVPKATGKMQCKKGPARDEQHLALVRKCKCLLQVLDYFVCRGSIQAHHVRCIAPRTMGKRVSDYLTVPLCANHHAKLHEMNEATFWDNNLSDPRFFIGTFSEAGRRALEALES